MVKDGKEMQEGSVMDIPEANAPKWIARGWGEPMGHKKEQVISEIIKESKK